MEKSVMNCSGYHNGGQDLLNKLEIYLQESANVNPKYKMNASWRKASAEESVSLSPNFKMPSLMKSGKKEQAREKESLDGIFKQVNIINNWIETIKNDTIALKQCHMTVQQTTRPESGTKDKIQSLMGNIRSLSSRAKGSLDELKKRKETEQDNGVRRVMETQYLILSRNFSDTVEEYRTTLDLYKKRNEDILKKQLLITDKEVTSEQLSNLLEAEDTAIFADDYLKDTSIARQQLFEARTRHAEILAIEKEIVEIRDLFFDLAMQVNMQGEMIDSIEYHVIKGLNRTHGGAKQISKAKEKKKRFRKNKILLILIVTIVLLIIIIFLLV